MPEDEYTSTDPPTHRPKSLWRSCPLKAKTPPSLTCALPKPTHPAFAG